MPLELPSPMGEAAPSELSCFIMGRRTLNIIQHLPKVTAVINSWGYCSLTFLCPWQLCECSTHFYTLCRGIQDIRYIDIHFGYKRARFRAFLDSPTAATQSINLGWLSQCSSMHWQSGIGEPAACHTPGQFRL